MSENTIGNKYSFDFNDLIGKGKSPHLLAIYIQEIMGSYLKARISSLAILWQSSF